jgi:hypothetical protein
MGGQSPESIKLTFYLIKTKACGHSQLSAANTLTTSSATVNEGSSVTFNVATKNVAAGDYTYTLGGTIVGADVSGGLLNGTFKIDALGSGFVSVQTLADSLTESSEMPVSPGQRLPRRFYSSALGIR